MSRHYVEITGVSQSDLEMMGYYLVFQNEMWTLYSNKDEAFIVHEKDGKRFIYVEDVNDAMQLAGRQAIPAPPVKVKIAK